MVYFSNHLNHVSFNLSRHEYSRMSRTSHLICEMPVMMKS